MKHTINPLTPPASLSEIARRGGWFCPVCNAFTGPTEETVGEIYARCERCHQAGVLVWRPPVLEAATEVQTRPDLAGASKS
jgi:hypothetical protein